MNFAIKNRVQIEANRQPPIRVIDLHRTWDEWATVCREATNNYQYHVYLESDISRARA